MRDFFNGAATVLGIASSIIFLLIAFTKLPGPAAYFGLGLLTVAILLSFGFLFAVWDTGSAFLGMAFGFFLTFMFFLLSWFKATDKLINWASVTSNISTAHSIFGVVLSLLVMFNIVIPDPIDALIIWPMFGIAVGILIVACIIDSIFSSKKPANTVGHVELSIILIGCMLGCLILSGIYLYY